MSVQFIAALVAAAFGVGAVSLAVYHFGGGWALLFAILIAPIGIEAIPKHQKHRRGYRLGAYIGLVLVVLAVNWPHIRS